MTNPKIKKMRKEIEKLSLENDSLKETLQQYEEKGILQLTAELLSLKAEYLSLLGENKAFREEYKRLINKQRKLNRTYQAEMRRR